MAEQKTCPECSSSNGWHKVECGRGRGPELSTPPVSALPESEYTPNEADPLALLRAAATTYDSWLDPEGFERAIEHVRADERAKRPDREQLAQTLFLLDEPYSPPELIHEHSSWALPSGALRQTCNDCGATCETERAD